MIEFPLLTSEDIECKVKQVTKTGCLMLLYKTSRTDARILDETVGPMNWTNRYLDIKGNLYCEVGIREDQTQDFVYKSDCGIESAQDDGNEKKAEASDAFKRCCSKLGIGRELYTSPQIWADVATVEKSGKWVLADPYAKYVVTNIEYNEKTRTIVKLSISNAKTNVVVFSWELPATGAVAQKMVKTITATAESTKTKTTKKSKTDSQNTEATEENDVVIPTEGSKTTISASKTSKKGNSTSETKKPLNEIISAIGVMVKSMYANGDIEVYNQIVFDISGKSDFKCSAATEEQYDIVKQIYDKLVEYEG